MSMVEGIRTAIAKAMVGQPGVLITNDALDLGARAAIEAMRSDISRLAYEAHGCTCSGRDASDYVERGIDAALRDA